MSLERLQEILAELEELDHSVGRSMEAVCYDRGHLTAEAVRLLTQPIVDLHKKQKKNKRKGRS